MERDWDFDWDRLSKEEKRTKNTYFRAQERALKVMQFDEADRTEILDAAERAHDRWMAAIAAINKFIRDWHRSVV